MYFATNNSIIARVRIRPLENYFSYYSETFVDWFDYQEFCFS